MPRSRQLPFLAYLLLFSLAVFSWTHANPHYNWDMLGYVAAVKAFTVADPVERHRQTFSELADAVPAERRAELVLGNDYRQHMAQDPEAFRQQAPFYRIRLIYTGLVHALSQTGIDPFAATHLVSTLAAAAGLWLLYFAFRPLVAPPLWYAYPLLALPLGVLETARLSTPDALAFLASVAIVHALLRESRWLYLALPLAILVRTDLILFVLPVLAWAYWTLPRQRPWVLASLALTLITYLGVNRYYGNYGWATLFYFTFIQQSPRPAELVVQFGLKEYLLVLQLAWQQVMVDKAFAVFCGLGLLSLALWRRPVGASPPRQRALGFLLLLNLGYVVLHFLLFPMIWERFFVAQYLLALVILLVLISNRQSNPLTQGATP
jgi:hypothetical protein